MARLIEGSVLIAEGNKVVILNDYGGVAVLYIIRDHVALNQLRAARQDGLKVRIEITEEGERAILGDATEFDHADISVEVFGCDTAAEVLGGSND